MRRFLHWLRGITWQARTRPAHRATPRRLNCRLILEPLEDRLAPAVVSWVNPVGGSWHNPANWSDGVTNRLPGAGDDVVIPDLAGTQTITHDTGFTEIASLTSAEKFLLSASHLQVSGNVSVASGFTVSGRCQVFGGTYLADTTITISGDANSDLFGVTINGNVSVGGRISRLTILDGLTLNGVLVLSTGIREDATILQLAGTQTIGGTGTISTSGGGVIQLLVTTPATTVTVAPGVTIRGAAGVTSNFADSTFVLQGTITATAGTILLDAPNWRNEGVLEALSGGRLRLSNTWSNSGPIRAFGTGGITLEDSGTLLANTTLSAEGSSNVSFGGVFGGTLNLSGHTLELSGAGRFEIGGTLHGGTVNQTNGAILRAVGGTLSALTLNGDLDVVGSSPNNAEPRITISNGLTFNGNAFVGAQNSTSGTIRLSNTQTIGGTGAIVFNGGSGNQSMIITGNNVTVTFAPGFSIRGGGGSITSNFANSTYVFQGRVAADRPSDGGLFGKIGISAVNWRNDGVMEAGPGSTLGLSGNGTNNGAIRAIGGGIFFGDTWTQAGTLSASGGGFDMSGTGTWLSTQPLTAALGSGSILRGDLLLARPLTLSGPAPFSLAGTLRDGTVNISGGGFLDGVGGTLSNVTLNGDLILFTATNHSADATITNGLTLNGTITITTPGRSESQLLRLRGSQTIDGSGEIVFHGGGANVLRIETINTTVSLRVGLRRANEFSSMGFAIADFLPANHNSRFLFGGLFNVVGGNVNLPANSGLASGGVIHVQPASSVSAGSGFSTEGDILIASGGAFSAEGTLTQTGGATTLSGSSAVLNAASVDLQGGILAGIGTVNASVTNAGAISPGLSPGILTINGGYTQAAAGSLAIELNGVAAGTGYDQLRVNGAVSLGGTLSVTRGFDSAVGDTFVVLEKDGSDAINGTFTDLQEGGIVTAGGMRFQITYLGGTGNDVLLTHINTAPVLAQIEDKNVIEETPLTFTVTATDVDAPPQTVSFTLDAGAPAGASIHPTAGVFSWTPTQAQPPGSYMITVRASDSGSPSLSDAQTFAVTVLESNQAPTDIALSNASVAENEPSGTVVGAFSTTDPDAGDTFSYALVSGSGDADNASFTIDAFGNLKTAATFDFETKSSYSIRVRSADAGGLFVERAFTISVTNVNEAPTAHAGGPYVILEGASLTLDASASFDTDLDPLTYSWDVNGDGTFGDATGVNPTLTAAQLDALGANDGPQTFNVRVRVDDGFGHVVDSPATTLTVDNTAPNVTLSGPASGVRGQSRSFTFAATDPSPADQAAGFIYTINWGDGSAAETVARTAGNGSGVSMGHVFTGTGTYTVTVTASDEDNGTSAVSSHTITISAIALQTDPCDPSGTALVVGGTTGTDFVVFSRGLEADTTIAAVLAPTSAGHELIVAAFRTSGPQYDFSFTLGGLTVTVSVSVLPSPITRLIGFGQAGNDDLNVIGSLALPAWLYGDAGNDRLKGGAGNDVLLGGADNDLLVGGQGRDLLIGGAGSDRLVGNADDDILIAGWAMLEGNDDALCAIMAEWTSANTYSQRTANLRASYLRTDGLATVFDDNAHDVLTGSAGQDWFFAQLDGDDSTVKDKITDLGASEFASDIDWILQE